MKKMLLVVMMGWAALYAAEPMLEATPFSNVAQRIGKGEALMVEVGSDRCYSCQKMGRLLYRVKKRHPDYPIYFINVGKEREAALRLKVQMIPTQIVFDGRGREVFRHVGVLKPKELQSVLKRYIAKKERS